MWALQSAVSMQTVTSTVRQMPVGWGCWCSGANISWHIWPQEMQDLGVKRISCDWRSVSSVSCSRLSVPVDGEVISLCCSPVTKTVALQLAHRQILKYFWGKLGPVKVRGLRCSYYRFLKRFNGMIWLPGSWVTFAGSWSCLSCSLCSQKWPKISDLCQKAVNVVQNDSSDFMIWKDDDWFSDFRSAVCLPHPWHFSLVPQWNKGAAEPLEVTTFLSALSWAFVSAFLLSVSVAYSQL